MPAVSRVRAAWATSQRFEGAQHGVEGFVYRPGVGGGVVVGEQAADGVLRCFAAVGVAPDTVGHHCQDALGLQLGALGGDGAAEILVARPGAGEGGGSRG